jgi:flagellar basal body-associated protein FliL
MAEEETKEPETEEAPVKSKSGLMAAILWGSIGLICGAGGFAVPLMFPGLFGGGATTEAKEPESIEETTVKTAYVEFGEVVVNLNSDRLNRYLRLNITLLIRETDLVELEPLVKEKKALLKSWMLSYLADVSMEDIRGAAGQNRLRREIQDHFNTVLFDDGHDRIREILFQEFNIQ